MPQTSTATRYGPTPAAGAPRAMPTLLKIAKITKTNTKVPMISLIRLYVVLRMAGPVLKTASLSP